MAQRDKYQVFHREGLRVVMRFLREAVWEMKSPGDWEHALYTFTEGLQALRIPSEGCSVHWLEPSGDLPAILSQYVWRSGGPGSGIYVGNLGLRNARLPHRSRR